MKDNSIFSPEQYEGVRRPIAEAYTLPPHCYTSREWYDAEVERVWRRNWLLLARLEEVPSSGNYLRVDIVGEPLLVTRGNDGVVRVMSAICRHRGCIIKEGKGTARALSCPYHGWTYNLTGALIGVPGMNDVENFRKEDFSLIPVRSEIWGGFVMINFDNDAPPLMDTLGPLAKRFESHRLEDMHVTRKYVNKVKGNWKIWLENSREGYHASVVHAQTYQRFFGTTGSGDWRYEGQDGVYEILSGSNEDGLLVPPSGGLPFVEGLSQEDRDSTHFAIYYPHILLNVAPSHITFHQLFPEGPDVTTVASWFCFPKSTVARPDFEEASKVYYESAESFIPEDIEVTVKTHDGLSGHLAKAGRFSLHERPCHAFSNWLLDQVIGPVAGR